MTHMNKNKLSEATFERLTALKSYKLISVKKRRLRATGRGFNFLKSENKQYYLGKILLTDKYRRTKHPDVFLACYREFVTTSEEKRASIRKSIFSGRGDEDEDLSEEDFTSYREFIENVAKRCGRADDIVGKVCDLALRNTIVGTIAPIDLPVEELSQIVAEFDALEKFFLTNDPGKTDLEANSEGITTLVIDNMLELHLEDVVRRNFHQLFPDLEIVDKNQHYRTRDGTYIDIFCKHKQDDKYTVIELKRDKPPSNALVQLLDYMNQIMEEFDTKKVAGILICKEIDRRTKSALGAIQGSLPEDSNISVIEFNLKMEYSCM
ncbi:DUF91 domain-containing protein [Methanoculleus sp. Afa-1]|uniref:DUF91 domain-containing protein n=2 Tax=Methanoculleus formosensis TaxID=2590886 RepID=A0A9E4ZLJ4_9EURY|nr:DUF91 domain-containing protein [Methanoculleus sp. Afa-1]